MTDYRKLSTVEKAKVDKKIIEEIEEEHCINEHNGFEWDEPQSTLEEVHAGRYCAECWMIYYNCLCSHEN